MNVKVAALFNIPQTGVASYSVGDSIFYRDITTLAALSKTMAEVSRRLRRSLLTHTRLQYVYCGPYIEFEGVPPPSSNVFVPVEDFKRLARFDAWTLRLDTFLRLAELHRVLPHVEHAVHQDLLVDIKNRDHLTWSLWLSNQHVNYYDNFEK